MFQVANRNTKIELINSTNKFQIANDTILKDTILEKRKTGNIWIN